MTPKIATCCYCGTRAALSLRGKERHELACSNCGAPLHEMKMLRSDAVDGPAPKRPPSPRKDSYSKYAGDKKKKHKKKARKPLKRRMMEELWDAAEDIFDIFD